MRKQMIVMMTALLLQSIVAIVPYSSAIAEERIEITEIYFIHGGASGPANIMCINGTGYPESIRVFIDSLEVKFTRSAGNGIQVKVPVNYAPENHTVQIMDQWKLSKSNLVRVRF